MEKLRYIDALRGWAVLGVLIVHCSKAGENNYPFLLADMFNNGAMGVQLFYVVSAFTLFLSHNRRANREKNPTLNFFIRRFFRIAPLFYIAIAYYLYQDGYGPRYWLGDMDHITTANVVSNFFFVHGFNPYWINSIVPGGWSISVEMMFYCLIPFLVTRIKDFNMALRFLMISLLLKTGLDIVLTTFPQIKDFTLWNSFLYFYLPSQLPVFAFGFIMYYLIANTTEANIVFDRRLLFYTTLSFLLQLAIGFNSSHLVFALLYMMLGWMLSRRESRWATNGLIVYMGKISFSLYLIHFAVLHWMEYFSMIDFVSGASIKGSLLNFSVRLLLLTGIGVAGATLSFHLIEQPFQKIGKRIIRFFESSQKPVHVSKS